MTECSESYDNNSIAANNNSSPPLSQRLPQHTQELELAPATSDTVRHSTTTVTMAATTTPAATLTAELPASFVCPITGRLMEDPVMDSCGHTYERRAILAYMKQCRQRDSDCRCPYSQKPLTVHDLIPNHKLGERIDKWRWQHEFNCSQLLDGLHDDPSGRRFVDVELQGQASFDENQQQPRQKAAHVAKTNGDDESEDDAEEDVRNCHKSRNRGPRYWGQRRRARHQRQKRYAPVSQQQPSCALSSSSGSTRSSDDAGTPSFRAPKSSASSAAGAGAPVSEWHPELLHVLPQELHVLSFVQERSQRERQKNLRERRTKCVARGASLVVVLALLAGAGLGLMLLVDVVEHGS
jgi:U-box domain